MGDREAIFARLAGRDAPPDAPPASAGPRLSFDDRVAAFARSLEAAGGRCATVPAAEVGSALTVLGARLGARHVFDSAEPEAAVPHALAHLDLAILRCGGPAVAESGAVWWAPASVSERAAGFLALHVAMVVPRAALVDHLHAAYEAIEPAAAGFGCFVAGPSKTADIEQSLVIGAHGPRSLTVLLAD